MGFQRHGWIALVVNFLLIAWLAGADSTRQKRQADVPFADGVSSLMKLSSFQNYHGQGQSQGQNSDFSGLMQLAKNLPQNEGNRVEVQLSDGKSGKDPEVSVVVENLSLEDLTNGHGKQQLSQLNSQLERAMKSLSYSVGMLQDVDQAEKMINQLQNPGLLNMLSGIGKMLTGGTVDQMFPGTMGAQFLQAVGQLTQALDRLPALQGLLEKFHRLLEHLHKSNPSAAKDMQQMMVTAITSLQGMLGSSAQGMRVTGVGDMMNMMEVALNNLNDNLDQVESALYGLEKMMEVPSFLLAVNDSNCLVKGLTGNLNTGIAAGCMRHLLQVLSMGGGTRNIIITINNVLIWADGSPEIIQSFQDFLQYPSFGNTLRFVQTMIMELGKADSNTTESLQTLQNVLKTLFSNPQLLQTIASLLENPDSSTVFENVMQYLDDAPLEDESTQIVLRVVNDTIMTMWREGDARQVIEKTQEMLDELADNVDHNQPLSEAQQALVSLLRNFLKKVQAVSTTVMPTTRKPPAITSTEPTSTFAPTTRPPTTVTSTVTTTTPETTTAETTTAETTTARPVTTTRGDGTVDNGGTSFSISAAVLAVSVSITALLY